MSGKPTRGEERHGTRSEGESLAPLLAGQAGDDVLQLTPPSPNTASPDWLAQPEGKFCLTCSANYGANIGTIVLPGFRCSLNARFKTERRPRTSRRLGFRPQCP